MERNSFRQIASLRAYFVTNNKMFLEQYREVHPNFVEQISEPIEKLDIPEASLAIFHGVRSKMDVLVKLNGQALRNIEEKTPKASTATAYPQLGGQTQCPDPSARGPQKPQT